MPNALQKAQGDEYGDGPSEDRLDEIEAIARETESKCRSWGWVRNLSARRSDRGVTAIVYPGTIAGAASLVNRLETAGIPWQTLDRALVHERTKKGGLVAISLRVVDERLIFDGERIRVHAGYSASALAHAASERGLLGLESWAEIGGSLGAVLRRGYDGSIWRVIDELVIARHGALRIIRTQGELLTGDQKALVDEGLILAATLRLFRNEREGLLSLAEECPAAILANDEGIASGNAIETNPAPAEEVIPLPDRIWERTQGSLDFELEYDVDVWRDEAEER
ncbi:MAG: hypothetical protein ABI882_18045 [Acidobacteriota bacterium]